MPGLRSWRKVTRWERFLVRLDELAGTWFITDAEIGNRKVSGATALRCPRSREIELKPVAKCDDRGHDAPAVPPETHSG